MAKMTTTEKDMLGIISCSMNNCSKLLDVSTDIFLYLHDVSKNKLVEHFDMHVGMWLSDAKNKQERFQTLMHTCIKIYFFKGLNFYLLDIFN